MGWFSMKIKDETSQSVKCKLVVVVISPLPVDDVQVSCYRILYSLYLLGTNKSIYVERYCAVYPTAHMCRSFLTPLLVCDFS